jgi:hypothetical protein
VDRRCAIVKVAARPTTNNRPRLSIGCLTTPGAPTGAASFRANRRSEVDDERASTICQVSSPAAWRGGRRALDLAVRCPAYTPLDLEDR